MIFSSRALMHSSGVSIQAISWWEELMMYPRSEPFMAFDRSVNAPPKSGRNVVR